MKLIWLHEQSRCIALMSNYSRTMDLTTAANNAAGASQAQYEKTLESLETKLNRLNNAYQTFLMGIMNSNLIKTGIDILNSFLNAINNVTGVLDKLSGGTVGTTTKILLLVAAFKSLELFSNGFIGAMKKQNTIMKSAKVGFSEIGAGANRLKVSLLGNEIQYKKLTLALQNYNRTQAESDFIALEKSIAKYGATVGLTAQETQVLASIIKTKRIPAEQSLNLVLMSVEDAELRAALATLGNAEASEEEKNKAYETITAKAAEAKTTEGLEGAQKKSLLTRLASKAAYALENSALKENKLVKKLSIVLTNLDTKATEKNTMAKIKALGVLGLIIIAIVAIIALTVQLIKQIKKSSDTERLKNLNTQVETLNNSYQTACDKLDDLNSKHDELAEMNSTFEDLTEGTTEWRMQLLKVNKEVISLINQYPKLAQYVSKGEFGQLEIRAEGWDVVLQEQMNAMQALGAATISAQMEVGKLAQEMAIQTASAEKQSITSMTTFGFGAGGGMSTIDWNNIHTSTMFLGGNIGTALTADVTDKILEAITGDKVIKPFLDNAMQTYSNFADSGPFGVIASNIISSLVTGPVGTIADIATRATGGYEKNLERKRNYGLTDEEFNDIAAAIAEQGVNVDNEKAVKEIFNQLNISTDKLDGFNRKVGELGTSFDELSNSALALKIQNETYARQLIDEYIQGNSLDERFRTQLEETIGMDYAETFDEKTDELTPSDKGDVNKSNVIKYAEITNQKIEDVYNQLSSGDLSKEALLRTIGANTAKSELSTEAKEITTYLRDLQKSGSNAYDFAKGIATKAGGGLTERQIGVIKDRLGMNLDEFTEMSGEERAEKINEVFTALGISLDSLGLSAEDAANNFLSASKNMEEAKAELKKLEVYDDFEGFIEGKGEEITSSQLTYLTDILNKAGGTDSELYKMIQDNILDGLSSEQITNALNIISTSEWDVTGINDMVDSLVELGYVSENSAYALKSELKDVSKAVYNVNLEKLTEQVKNLQSAVSKIKEREVGKAITFSKQEMDSLIESTELSKDDFWATGEDEFQYIGNEIDLLYSAIENLTNSIDINSQIQTLNGQIAKGEKLRELINNDKDSDKYWDDAVEIIKNNSYAQLTGEEEGKLVDLYNELMGTSATGLAENMYKELQQYADSYTKLSTLKDDYEKATIQLQLVSSVSTNPEDILNGKLTPEQQKNALLQQIGSTAGSEVNTIKLYNDLKSQGVMLNGKLAKSLLALGVADTKEYNTKKELVELYNDYVENLGNIRTQQEFLEKTTDLLNKTMFKEAAVTQDFVNENINLITAMLSGGESAAEAEKQLMIKRAQNLQGLSKLAKDSIGKIYEYIANTNGSAFTLEQLRTSLNLTTIDAEELALILKTLGAVVQGDLGTFTSFTSIANDIANTASDAASEFENSYDRLYNLLNNITEVQNERNRLEKEYDLILKRENLTGKQLVDNVEQRYSLLKKEYELTKQKIYGASFTDEYGNTRVGRIQQIRNLQSDNSDLLQYAKYDETSRTVDINWNLIQTSGNDRVTEYVDKLQEIADEISSGLDELQDIEEEIRDIKNLNRDVAIDLLQRVYDALVNEQQVFIDDLNSSLEASYSATKSILEEMKESIDLQRQIRDNTKTEEDLSDKRQQLLYLQQDTSGANQLSILQLQEQLQNAEEDYTDTLIDQKITELENQNEEAREQRQNQLDIQQAVLDWREENGYFWTEAAKTISEGYSSGGDFLTQSRLVSLLQSKEGWAALSELEKEKWADELNQTAAKSYQYWNQSGNYGYSSLTNLQSNTKGILSALNASDGVTSYLKTTNSAVSSINTNIGTMLGTLKDILGKIPSKSDTSGDDKSSEDDIYGSPIPQGPLQGEIYGPPTPETVIRNQANELAKRWTIDTPELLQEFGINPNNDKKYIFKDINGKKYSMTYNELSDYAVSGETNGLRLTHFITGGKITIPYNLLQPRKYATGGLADFTGPAWLDGTKSKPEIVLNQADSQNFIQLRDVLRDLNNQDSTYSNKTDSYIDIDINVDSIDSDYDVDQLANRVKEIIVEDSSSVMVNESKKSH